MGVTAPRSVDRITATEILPIAVDTVPLHLHHGSCKNIMAYFKSTDSLRLHFNWGREAPPDMCLKGIFNCTAVLWNDTKKPALLMDYEAINK